MPKSKDPGPDPIGRLDERLAAFEADRRKPRTGLGLGSTTGASDGYRLLAQMLGGVFGGLGLGWMVDHFAHTRPFGLVSGLLVGATMSVVAMIRMASRMSARPPASNLAPTAPDDEDD